jgi:methyl-accepting chemotaxis protein
MPEKKPNVEKMALAITRAVGSPASIIIHTLVFAASFLAVSFDFIDFDRMLLILTTIVSLEAIYLAIFIQMTINYQGQDIAEVQEDLEEIQEDVEEISEDIDELQEDVEEISEDVEEMSEEEETEEAAEERRKTEQKQTLEIIQSDLRKLLDDVERLKNNHKSDNMKPLL